jgi:hypothetical protein
MGIGILGWGSLLREGGLDFDRWHGPWEYDGPTLKLEFSRVSENCLKALTLVIEGFDPKTTGLPRAQADRCLTLCGPVHPAHLYVIGRP